MLGEVAFGTINMREPGRDSRKQYMSFKSAMIVDLMGTRGSLVGIAAVERIRYVSQSISSLIIESMHKIVGWNWPCSFIKVARLGKVMALISDQGGKLRSNSSNSINKISTLSMKTKLSLIFQSGLIYDRVCYIVMKSSDWTCKCTSKNTSWALLTADSSSR